MPDRFEATSYSSAPILKPCVKLDNFITYRQLMKGQKQFRKMAANVSNKEAAIEFSSPGEEVKYWRERALDSEREAKEVKEEFQEFQEGSRELEAELETQLEQSEHKVKEYRSLNNQLQVEIDQLDLKLDQCHRNYHFQISQLQTDLLEIKSIKDELTFLQQE